MPAAFQAINNVTPDLILGEDIIIVRWWVFWWNRLLVRLGIDF